MGKYNEKWDKLKPQRPRKPRYRYANFVSNFARENKFPENPQALMENAALAWRNMDEDEKMQFHDQNAIDEYRRQMANYRATMAAMKGPPSGYNIFVREYWHEHQPRQTRGKQNRRRWFRRIQVDVSRAWARKSDAERELYRDAANRLRATMEGEQEAILQGQRELDLNWRQERINGIMDLVNRNKAELKQDDEMGERSDSNDEEKE